MISTRYHFSLKFAKPQIPRPLIAPESGQAWDAEIRQRNILQLVKSPEALLHVKLYFGGHSGISVAPITLKKLLMSRR
jgi:hypothetical protein